MDAILRQTGILFLLLALGFLASKLGWLSRETRGGISNILLYIVTPCVIVQSFQYPSSAEKWRAMGVEAAILAAFMLLGLAAGLLAFRRESGARRATATFGAAMGNVGFMGVPVIGALVGDEGMLYVSVAMAVFNVICWTVGVRVFDKKAFQPKVLATSPVLYSVAIGLLMFLFQWRLPVLIDGVTEMVAAVATPLSMMVVGAILAESPAGTILKDRTAVLSAAARLILIPLLALGTCTLLGIRGEMRMILVLISGMPSATNTVLLSLVFHGDEELGSRMVVLSTMLYLPVVIGWMLILG